ncbi:MAG: hypothetical protein K2X69_17575, partial [Silvanigrellaceae bacterium]|nr:hypothetical protein [Silvanigrellaceae bacterium]
MNVLPPMRREILFQVLKIVFLSSALSLFLILSIYFSAKNPKNTLLFNYQSINSLLLMLDNLDSLFLAQNNLIQLRKKEVENFEENLAHLEKEKDNLESLKKMREIFEKYKNNKRKMDYNEYFTMRSILKERIQNYQNKTSKIIADRESFTTKVLILSVIIFLISLSISIYFSEKISGKIAYPIKKISEVLQNKPSFGQKLKFPLPENLEIKNLILELNELWKRLSEIHNNNVKSLNAQRNEFDVVLDTIEDPIVVLDHLGKIEHHNKYFANLVGAKGHSLNFQAWNDVSLSSLTYLHLRNLLRIENMEETLFWTAVDHSDKIFRLRKRYIFDSNKK